MKILNPTQPNPTLVGLVLFAIMSVFAPMAGAQGQADAEEAEALEEVVVYGIRGALANALEQKREANNLIEVIQSEDIGKLPDQNLAEVLENVTGIQITREAGVGTGVQIRGTNANRTEINGVSTVGSGAERSGIDFEDVSAAMISSVEVVKAPEAKTIEGSVGGTINLRTIRPLELKETLAAVRLQGEDSSLTADDGLMPRISGTYGDNWKTEAGDIGVVVSYSYSEQDVTAFRPRTDRDNSVLSDSGAASAQSFHFLPIQFFVQDYDNFEYETTNFAGSFEWAPEVAWADSLKLYFDTVINDQERLQESSRIQASGISGLRNTAVPDEFETVNFGSLGGRNGSQNLGSIQAAVRGVIPLDGDGSDGNLRFSGDTSSRVTDSKIFRWGADWEWDKFSGRVEISTSESDTKTPNFSTTLNFINPNSPLDRMALLANHRRNVANSNEALYDSNENGTPFAYDLTGGSLAFGIAFDATNAPTVAQLLDPANVVLRDVQQAQNKAENSEDAFLADLTYDLDWKAITTLDFGFRWNKTSSLRDEIRSSVGLRELADSPTGDLFSSILTRGPTNFNDADGRDLYVRNFLLINPERVNSDPAGVLAVLNAAIAANNAVTGSTRAPIGSPTSNQSAFFDIEEETNALYAQANFEHGIFRGNFGFRYVQTDVTSVGNRVLNDVTERTTTKGDYDFFLPRFNLVVDLSEVANQDIILRTSWSKDIRRPDFDDLSTSFSFDTSPNPAVDLGNPALEPEEVESFDLSAEWYFAPSAVVSIGYFRKERTGVFFQQDESPIEDPTTNYRDITDPCEGGGIFNPIADINVFGPPGSGVGVCVPTAQTVNGSGETTQDGFELAFQYDLSHFEDKLGWASGFGILANYTKQEFDGSDEFYEATSRAGTVFTALGATEDVTLRHPLIDLSENAYNFTVFYEKYGLSARMRYTWREAYRSTDYGSTSSNPWGFPVVQGDRGQLNASVSYEVYDNLNIGIEAVNITEEEIEQHCINEGALLCYQGFTDRRITLGVSYRL